MPALTWFHTHESPLGEAISNDGEGQKVYVDGPVGRAAELVALGRASPKDFSVVVGASSWAQGQLEAELQAGVWIMAKAPAQLVFAGRSRGSALWRDMLLAMRGEYASFADIPAGVDWLKSAAVDWPSDWE
ncbi:unnamed protein product [Discosporangium mesarthrocarpum]